MTYWHKVQMSCRQTQPVVLRCGVLFRLGLDQNIRIFVWWVGIRFSILRFEFRISFFFFFFFLTPGIPRETVLNLSAWLNICTSNRRDMWTDPLLSQNRMRCMRFLSVNCPEMRVKVLDQRAVALVVQTRCADVKPLWESEREKTRSSWITHAVFKWLI